MNTINEQWTQHSVLVKKGAMVAVTPKRVSLKEARYGGLSKTHGQHVLEALAYN